MQLSGNIAIVSEYIMVVVVMDKPPPLATPLWLYHYDAVQLTRIILAK
jgi:hypothetical protein